jgi:hypothetical protein
MIFIVTVYVLASLVLILLADNLIRIRDFRHEVFRLRDEARFAFIRELSQCENDDARAILKEQFFSLQSLLNAILEYPVSYQLALLKAMTERYKHTEVQSAQQHFRDFPMLFQRIIILTAMTMVRHMLIKTLPGFLYFLARAHFSSRVEQWGMSDSASKMSKPRTARILPKHGRFAQDTSFVPWAESLLKLKPT